MLFWPEGFGARPFVSGTDSSSYSRLQGVTGELVGPPLPCGQVSLATHSFSPQPLQKSSMPRRKRSKLLPDIFYLLAVVSCPQAASPGLTMGQAPSAARGMSLTCSTCPLLACLGGTPHIFFLPHSGETSLHQAAALRHRTICHYIVEAGASLMKTDLQVMVGGLGGVLLWGWQELGHTELSEEQFKGWSFCQCAACTWRRHQGWEERSHLGFPGSCSACSQQQRG